MNWRAVGHWGVIIGALCWGAIAQAAGVGRIAYASGEAWVERAGEQIAAEPGMTLERRDFVVTGERGRVKVVLSDGSRIYVGAHSRLEMAQYARRDARLAAVWNMFWGRARFFVRHIAGEGEFAVRTTTAVLGVRGTSFLVLSPKPPRLNVLAQKKPEVLRDFEGFRKQVKLPARVVLHTGRLVVQTIAGARTELSAGRAADIDVGGQVKVRRAEKSLEKEAPPVPQPEEKGEKAKQKEEKAPGGKVVKRAAREEKAGEGKKERPAPGKAPERRISKGKVPARRAAGGMPGRKAPEAPAPKVPAPALRTPVPAPPKARPEPVVIAPPTRSAPAADVGTALQNAKQTLAPRTKVTIKPQFVLP